MRIATWNVNSIRTRVGRVTDWLLREDIDVLTMQELKCRPDQFPMAAFEEAGYEVVLHGLNQWNGVGIASRLPLEEVTVGFDGMPHFGSPAVAEARALGATVEGVRVWSLYVPNGRALTDPHYEYKLAWLAQLAKVTQSWLAAHPGEPLALTGDWNIAPLDSDVWDLAAFEGATHVSAAERAAFTAFTELGLHDVVRPLVPEGYTYWDYKALRFPRNEGMRIDFILGNDAFQDLMVTAEIHRDERKGDGPSDHVPVVAQLDIALDDLLDRPMIF